jgi:hypothetical protein
LIEIDPEYVRGAAYHEAAHIVVAAVQGLPLGKGGLRIDKRGAGLAEYGHTKANCLTNAGPDAYKGRTIIATRAGHIAHGKIYPPAATGDANWWHDIELMDRLLVEMYPTSAVLRDDAREKLFERSEDLVEQHWETIKVIAEALWAKLPEARIEGVEVIALLMHRGISAVLDED